MSESFEDAINIGKQGVELFYKQYFNEAKNKCIEACRILQKFKNQGSKIIFIKHNQPNNY
jgi:hypothetical protein